MIKYLMNDYNIICFRSIILDHWIWKSTQYISIFHLLKSMKMKMDHKIKIVASGLILKGTQRRTKIALLHFMIFATSKIVSKKGKNILLCLIDFDIQKGNYIATDNWQFFVFIALPFQINVRVRIKDRKNEFLVQIFSTVMLLKSHAIKTLKILPFVSKCCIISLKI